MYTYSHNSNFMTKATFSKFRHFGNYFPLQTLVFSKWASVYWRRSRVVSTLAFCFLKANSIIIRRTALLAALIPDYAKYSQRGAVTSIEDAFSVTVVHIVKEVDNLTFRHRASCILGQAFHCSPENAFYIFNQQIYFIIWYLLDRASLIYII